MSQCRSSRYKYTPAIKSLIHGATNFVDTLRNYKVYQCSSTLKIISSRQAISAHGLTDRHLSLVDICPVVGTVHLYKYWPLVRSTPTVLQCDVRQCDFTTRCHVPTTRYTGQADKVHSCLKGQVFQRCQLEEPGVRRLHDGYSSGYFGNTKSLAYLSNRPVMGTRLLREPFMTNKTAVIRHDCCNYSRAPEGVRHQNRPSVSNLLVLEA